MSCERTVKAITAAIGRPRRRRRYTVKNGVERLTAKVHVARNVDQRAELPMPEGSAHDVGPWPMVGRGHDGLGDPAQEEETEQRRGRARPEHDHVATCGRIEARPQLVDGESRHEAQDRADGHRRRHAPRECPGADVLRQKVADPGIPRRARDGTQRGGDDQEAEERRDPGARRHCDRDQEDPDPGQPSEAGSPPADRLPASASVR